ncbi:GNAT family N-acetyltransferase [Clostridium tepidum]|jgi:RimJ/RimL family protein N-acetyltransferase|uniref:GNAT family N-acetyltransferase n=1 Tax=Clostridium tepidum TaxID=1962263 RepID=A0A1S9I528_9CLOT|nr:GNAT family N-acetyltransferase [Clostridium tepidum]MCR1933179.1 GNAT family N-acetyltransferase [Clostridium tepidum]MDU6877341.1 GNAT family N-acetyltransferase [Clostridium botulinum]OOO62766.1 GNAT family N-acetyltransferase [Clostridium tepidum]OOO65447.1 GNAT family N-acetyltransferase [Clostridium tepidum]
MEISRLETDRLILRNFERKDMEALYLLLRDKEVNKFLPWFPVKTMEETRSFFEERFKDQKYSFAICLKENDYPIGYVKVETNDSYDLGYAICKEFWHKGIVTEASKSLFELLKKDGIPYITATHDKNNPRSGGVMQQLGMKYCYSYREQWQSKNILVTFRMYQLNFDGQENRVYKKYWDLYDEHFIESDV